MSDIINIIKSRSNLSCLLLTFRQHLFPLSKWLPVLIFSPRCRCCGEKCVVEMWQGICPRISVHRVSLNILLANFDRFSDSSWIHLAELLPSLPKIMNKNNNSKQERLDLDLIILIMSDNQPISLFKNEKGWYYLGAHRSYATVLRNTKILLHNKIATAKAYYKKN